jgi:hypothetical protein
MTRVLMPHPGRETGERNSSWVYTPHPLGPKPGGTRETPCALTLTAPFFAVQIGINGRIGKVMPFISLFRNVRHRASLS